MMIDLSPRQLVALAGMGSAALLVGALGFQALGYAPCDLCILQRWPHLAAAVIALAAMLLRGGHRALALAGAIAAAVATALAGYHAGIEWGFWAGPSSCTGAANIAGLSVQDLMKKIEAAPVIRCDEVPWQMLGLSMAGWNALISAGLTVVWMLAAGGGLRLARR